MAIENPPFEDVFPVESVFSNVILVCRGVTPGRLARHLKDSGWKTFLLNWPLFREHLFSGVYRFVCRYL